MSELRIRECPRRPVRQLRPLVGSVRSDRTAMPNPRHRPGEARDVPLLLPVQRPRSPPQAVDLRRQRILEAPRPDLRQELARRRSQGPPHYAGSGVGHRSPGPRIRDETDLRLVRGRHGISDRDEGMVSTQRPIRWMEGFLVRPEGSSPLFRRERQHRVPHPVLARHPDGLRREAHTPLRRSRDAIPEFLGRADEHGPRQRHLAP